MNELLRPTLRALLGLVLLTAASAQSLLGPPRGTFGPGAGDALRGGPGDRGDVAPDGSGTGRAFVDPGSWQRWWAFNRDPYLLRIRVPGGDPLGPTALDGPPRAVTNPSRPADDVLAETVLPALLALLERHGRDNDVRGAVYLALGKIGLPPGPADDPLRVAVLSAVREGLEDRNEATREAAILALGVLGDARVGRDLVEVALGMKAGRKVLAGRGLDRRTRAIAAYAVASIGAATHREVERVFVAGQLERLLAAEPDDTDIGAAAVIGLGLTPAPFARTEPASAELPGRARAVSLLLDALEEGDELDVRALAQAPVAVARLVTARTAPSGAKSAAVEEARAALRVRGLQVLTRVARGEGRGRRKTAAIREGAAQGLGLLIDPVRAEAGSEAPDRAALEALFELARTGQEREAGLALLALARVAARGPAVADELTPWITGVARDGTGSARPWALVALGVLLGEVGAGHPARAPRYGALEFVRERVTAGTSPDERAAAGLALGLAGSPGPASAAMVEALDEGDFHIRGLYAMALALAGEGSALEALREILASAVERPYLVRDAATALMLLGDPYVADQLANRLARARFIPERIAALQALAWSSDPRAVALLVEITHVRRFRGRAVDQTSRAFAAAALGALCGREAAPWNGLLARDVVWSSAPPSLTDRRDGGGVLDLF